MFRFAPKHLERFQARDLAALIDLYEANYTRLMQLVPDIDAFDSGTVVSRVSGALDLLPKPTAQALPMFAVGSGQQSVQWIAQHMDEHGAPSGGGGGHQSPGTLGGGSQR